MLFLSELREQPKRHMDTGGGGLVGVGRNNFLVAAEHKKRRREKERDMIAGSRYTGSSHARTSFFFQRTHVMHVLGEESNVLGAFDE